MSLWAKVIKNGDGVVNSLDVGGIMANYFNIGAAGSDINLDGVTNSLDIGLAMKQYFTVSNVPD